MSYLNHPLRQTHFLDYSSAMRNPSNASTTSTIYSNSSGTFEIHRTSTRSSNSSCSFENQIGGGELKNMPISVAENLRFSPGSLPVRPSKSTRSLTLSLDKKQDPLVFEETKFDHNRTYSLDTPKKSLRFSGKQHGLIRPDSMMLSRANSISKGSDLKRGLSVKHPQSPISTPDLDQLQKSSTSQLRTLSKFARNISSDEFSILNPSQEVTGLHGRRRLQRIDKAGKDCNSSPSGSVYRWESRNWMDNQRQFLQAYEYLCHIGEAKEWIEDVLQKPIPPIIQLEEALRDGVTLAEIVATVNSDRKLRIFRHPKLQYRHSDNIAIFFRFLAEVELPELFRFELTDLYEKKNTPKVIYCIHALSWLLYRNGTVSFHIGNLLGQLEFEHHELEEMQKGLDKSGVSMPSFGNMSADFQVKSPPSAKIQPIESEEHRITRELQENLPIIIDLQAQARGTLVRLRLGTLMQQLWSSEDMLIELQSIIRGEFSRQVSEYRISMRLFAINLQSGARGYLARRLQENLHLNSKTHEAIFTKLQNIIRANKIRDELRSTKSQLVDSSSVTKELQASFRGYLSRKKYMSFTKELEARCSNVTHLQATIQGYLLRKKYKSHSKELEVAGSNLIDLQALCRGYLSRKKHKSFSKEFEVARSNIVDLQASIRGYISREKYISFSKELEAVDSNIIDLQASFRGYLFRKTYILFSKKLKVACSNVVHFQASIRGYVSRKKYKSFSNELELARSNVIHLQASCWGYLSRKKINSFSKELELTCSNIVYFQASIRGYLFRNKMESFSKDLEVAYSNITHLQASIRGYLYQKKYKSFSKEIEATSPLVISFQATVRGNQYRKKYQAIIQKLNMTVSHIVLIQSIIRAKSCRRSIEAIISKLSNEIISITDIQARTRGMILRRNVRLDHETLFTLTRPISKFQAMALGFSKRYQIQHDLRDLEFCIPDISRLQASLRGMFSRIDLGTLLEKLEENEVSIISLQAIVRACLVRSKFREKLCFFKENMEKIVKIQSFFRSRVQGEAYKSLTTGKNPPVNTVKNFVHLLNDSDFDFNEELEFECLRKNVVQQVRQNEIVEQYIDQLDIKIALLVKNKITLDEVVKHQKNYGGHPGNLLVNTSMASGNQFDLKALNKNSRKKLELYQQLFFNLQTQSQYLARLFKRIREQGTAEKDCRRIETLMMVLFGYAQKRREEYYLLKLIARSAKEEIDSAESITEYLRGNYFWTKILANYMRSPRDRKFLRELLGPLIQVNIIEDPALDLESDPMQIYCSAINNEELRTGRPSHRSFNIPREQAIKDSETRDLFIAHLRDLREVVDEFLVGLESLVHKMPYGVRFVCQQIFQNLCEKFSNEPQEFLLHVVGSWLWRFYLQPALKVPETMGVVEKQLTPLQKRNLSEVAKVLNQVSSGRLFGGENIYLQPLNAYVGDAIKRIKSILTEIISVSDIESTFHIDEFNDLYAKAKPTLYIKMDDIFAIHQLIAVDLTYICPNRDDMLREIVYELGSAKNNENEMVGVSSTEIQMNLSPTLHEIEDPEADIKALFMETKRCVLYIIRVQTGSNLMEILVRPVTPENEIKWCSILEEEFSTDDKTRGAYSDVNTLSDIKTMSYKDIKRIALENIMQLEQLGRISRQNFYQDILNAIALDIRTKNRRRAQRHRELEAVRLNLTNLNEKAEWLESQRKSYDNYIEQAMMTLQKKG